MDPSKAEGTGKSRVSLTLVQVAPAHPDARTADTTRHLQLDATHPAVILGRASKNRGLIASKDNLWINSPIITKEHARFLLGTSAKEPVILRDLNSTHGTFVCDRELTTDCAVQDGDVIQFGTDIQAGTIQYRPHIFLAEIRWQDVDAPPTPHASTPMSESSRFAVPDMADDSDVLSSDNDDFLTGRNRRPARSENHADSLPSRQSSASRNFEVPYSDEENETSSSDSSSSDTDDDNEADHAYDLEEASLAGCGHSETGYDARESEADYLDTLRDLHEQNRARLEKADAKFAAALSAAAPAAADAAYDDQRDSASLAGASNVSLAPSSPKQSFGSSVNTSPASIFPAPRLNRAVNHASPSLSPLPQMYLDPPASCFPLSYDAPSNSVPPAPTFATTTSDVAQMYREQVWMPSPSPSPPTHPLLEVTAGRCDPSYPELPPRPNCSGRPAIFHRLGADAHNAIHVLDNDDDVQEISKSAFDAVTPNKQQPSETLPPPAAEKTTHDVQKTMHDFEHALKTVMSPAEPTHTQLAAGQFRQMLAHSKDMELQALKRRADLMRENQDLCSSRAKESDPESAESPRIPRQPSPSDAAMVKPAPQSALTDAAAQMVPPVLGHAGQPDWSMEPDAGAWAPSDELSDIPARSQPPQNHYTDGPFARADCEPGTLSDERALSSRPLSIDDMINKASAAHAATAKTGDKRKLEHVASESSPTEFSQSTATNVGPHVADPSANAALQTADGQSTDGKSDRTNIGEAKDVSVARIVEQAVKDLKAPSLRASQPEDVGSSRAAFNDQDVAESAPEGLCVISEESVDGVVSEEPPRKKQRIAGSITATTQQQRRNHPRFRRLMGKLVPFVAGAAATATAIFGAAGVLISTMPDDIQRQALAEMGA